MQYKIPLQIENEDIIMLGLSLRQLAIIAIYGWVAYTLFQSLEPQLWWTLSLIFAAPVAIIWIVIALMRIAEMTFLPVLLNTIRLSLNGKQRIWSQWTDSYSEMEIGYITANTSTKTTPLEDKTFSEISKSNDFAEKLKNI